MNVNFRQRVVLALLSCTLLLTGCTLNPFARQQPTSLPPVGIYKSTDRGETWTTKNNILTTSTGRPNLNLTNISSLLIDPTDHEALYAGGVGQGLFVTTNGAEGWLQSRSVKGGTISSLAIPKDPKLRCTTFAAIEDKILRSADCGRSWETAYQEGRPKVTMVSVVINSQTPTTIYAATSTGDVLKSLDNGVNWLPVGRFKDGILTLIAHPLKPDTIYVFLKSRGAQKTEDGGSTWLDLSEGLKQYNGATRMTAAAIDPARPETVIVASKYGLLRSIDGGKTWEQITLLTAPGQANIYSVAVNPKDSAQIYYTSDKNLYRSSDAGKTWETKDLPVSGARSIILVDPEAPDTLYMGVNRPQKGSPI